jgi:hypothetical protein
LPDPRRSKAVDNGGLRCGAVEGALRPPLPTATQSALHNPTILLALRGPKIHIRLTDPLRRNIIASIRGSERWVAGFKSESRPGFRSESVDGFLLELVAGFVGIRTPPIAPKQNRFMLCPPRSWGREPDSFLD